jgi:hypothetical protein
MNAHEPPEFGERQFRVVDMNGHLSVRAGVVDDATEHVATRDPLIAILVIVDLLISDGLFDDRLVPAGRFVSQPMHISGQSRPPYTIPVDGVWKVTGPIASEKLAQANTDAA